MKIAIMQPYIFPYIGYFQLIYAADVFVVYDNIKYTKKGWINRNRILVNGKDDYITLPLKKDSDYLDIKDRYLAGTWSAENKSILDRVTAAYRKSPYFDSVFPVIEKCIMFEDLNLFKFILNSLQAIKAYLGIQTPILISSAIGIDHQLKATQKVIEICKNCGAETYVNPIGGIELYGKEEFKKHGIDLYFLRSAHLPYRQFENEFLPFLSIIDVLMFNSIDRTKEMLNKFDLV